MQRLFVIGLLLLAVSACNTPEKLLCSHPWKVVDADFDVKQIADPTQKPIIIQQMKDSMQFTFVKKDHIYSVRMSQHTESGKWKYDKATNSIITQTEHSGARSNIKSLTKDFLSVEVHDKNGMEMTLLCQPDVTSK